MLYSKITVFSLFFLIYWCLHENKMLRIFTKQSVVHKIAKTRQLYCKVVPASAYFIEMC